MKNEWRKRLGAFGVLTLLGFAAIGGAVAQAASAATPHATTEFDVQVLVDNSAGGALQPPDFTFQVDGGTATAFNANGINQLFLDDTTTYTFTISPQDGYDITSSAGCTGATFGTGNTGFCLFRATFVPPVTTTTTTTTIPETTTTPPAGQISIHGSATDTNNCTSVLQPALQPNGTTPIGVTLSSDAAPQPHFGDPITLSTTVADLNIPAGLIQKGVDVGLIHDGLVVPSTVTLVVAASNTTEGTHQYQIDQSATVHVTGTGKNAVAQPLQASAPLPNTTWHPADKNQNVFFTEKSLKIVSALHLGALSVTATFTCQPSGSESFIAIGANGAPVTTTIGSTVPGSTTPTTAAVAANELPRTGSNPWPLLALAAVCFDLGLLAIAGGKRGRRRIVHR